MKGKLIVLEGIDGSGKGTQVKRLIENLKKAGHDVEYVDFPNYEGFHGSIVGRYLKREFGDPSLIHPVLASYPYAYDRRQAQPKIAEWLEQGRIVVANRYVTSNMAYQAAKLESRKEQDSFLEWVTDLEYNYNKMPKPDIVVWLKVDPDISAKLILKKAQRQYLGDESMDGHEAKIDYMRRVHDMYSRLSEDKRWLTINCCEKDILPVDTIETMIYDAVLPIIG